MPQAKFGSYQLKTVAVYKKQKIDIQTDRQIHLFYYSVKLNLLIVCLSLQMGGKLCQAIRN